MKLSLVIPAHDEVESVGPLLEACRAALEGIDYEIVIVDDGSRDGTAEAVARRLDARTRLLRLRANCGQTVALATGIAAARGELVATMDGDLQNDPRDLPRMIELLEDADADLVAGRRADRQDVWLSRRFPSRLANALIRKVTGVKVRDLGCTLRVMRADLARQLPLQGDMHRFISVLAAMQGARIVETDVTHHARQFGRSKYGFARTGRVLADLMLLGFQRRYLTKPIHLLGGVGLASFVAGSAILTGLVGWRLLGHDIWGRPLLILAVLLTLAGLQFATLGIVLDYLTRLMMQLAPRGMAPLTEEVISGTPRLVTRPVQVWRMAQGGEGGGDRGDPRLGLQPGRVDPVH